MLAQQAPSTLGQRCSVNGGVSRPMALPVMCPAVIASRETSMALVIFGAIVFVAGLVVLRWLDANASNWRGARQNPAPSIPGTNKEANDPLPRGTDNAPIALATRKATHALIKEDNITDFQSQDSLQDGNRINVGGQRQERCRHCGELVEGEIRFCPHCGKLRQSTKGSSFGWTKVCTAPPKLDHQKAFLKA